MEDTSGGSTKATPAPLHIRLPSETLDAVRALALAEERPVTTMARILIKHGLASYAEPKTVRRRQLDVAAQNVQPRFKASMKV